MTDLTDRLDVLLRRFTAGCDAQPPIAALDRLREDFRWELELLIVKYGQAAVDKAIDAMPDTWPSVLLH